MCMICVKGKDCKWEPELVVAMARGNRDGFGIMFVDKDPETGEDDVQVFKSMGSPEEVAKIYEQHMDKDIAIHVRIATHGEKNEENCHPYCVTSKKMGHPRTIYMMHNGRIADVQMDKTMSDSWNFATHFLRGVLSKNPEMLHDEDFQQLLAGLIGFNKLVFLDDLNRFVVINDDLGMMQDGCWISAKSRVTPAWGRPVTTGAEDHASNFQRAAVGTGTKSPKNNGHWARDADGRSRFISASNETANVSPPVAVKKNSEENSDGDDDKEGPPQSREITSLVPIPDQTATDIEEEEGATTVSSTSKTREDGVNSNKKTQLPWGSWTLEKHILSMMGKEEIASLVLQDPFVVVDTLHTMSRES